MRRYASIILLILLSVKTYGAAYILEEDSEDELTLAQVEPTPKSAAKDLLRSALKGVDPADKKYQLEKATDILGRLEDLVDFVSQVKSILKPGMTLLRRTNIIEALEGYRATSEARATLLTQAKEYLADIADANYWADLFCTMQRISPANRAIFIKQSKDLSLSDFPMEDRLLILFTLTRIEESKLEAKGYEILEALYYFNLEKHKAPSSVTFEDYTKLILAVL